ncbi:hypothetical protein TNCV_5071141 [Trichonephila clavipes]|nr:hypothetical protein TNCV_5071141 [Trichonephila clavipes]
MTSLDMYPTLLFTPSFMWLRADGTSARGVIVYCLASKRWQHSDWNSQWIKECPPGDKRRSLSYKPVCRLGRCRENGSKEQRRWDKKKGSDADGEM